MIYHVALACFAISASCLQEQRGWSRVSPRPCERTQTPLRRSGISVVPRKLRGACVARAMQRQVLMFSGFFSDSAESRRLPLAQRCKPLPLPSPHSWSARGSASLRFNPALSPGSRGRRCRAAYPESAGATRRRLSGRAGMAAQRRAGVSHQLLLDVEAAATRRIRACLSEGGNICFCYSRRSGTAPNGKRSCCPER